VQAIHAALESARTFSPPSQHPHLVVLGVRDERALYGVRARLQSAALGHVCFREPDLSDALTAIATEPLVGRDRHFFTKYQLLKGE
jgi:hypothetical protein